MTQWAEPGARETERESAFGTRRHAGAAIAQEAVLPSGVVVVSCSAPFGRGGLGRHLEEIVGALGRRKQTALYICEGQDTEPTSSAPRGRISGALTSALRPLGRVSPAWRMLRASVEFDEYAARRLPPANHLIGFNGTSLAQFRASTDGRFESLSLVSANTHYRHVVRQHAKAYKQHPIERPWSTFLSRRNLLEYARADRIYVSSQFVRESFLEEGVPEDRLSLFPLTPHPRFVPGERPRASSTFDVVYMGALTVDKGVPLLVDAVRRLPHGDLRLLLVGGWGTRGMRRFLERACAEDPRIKVTPGDPLPHLQGARLYVHPTYIDGFGYAPAEALACGVPVLVSEDTGMKELLDPPRNGLILPTGNLTALSDAIDAAYRTEILNGDLAGGVS
jgi:glycosyltransferase involved in cell wall biosynthesis